jgi:hypothetical protein
MVIASVKDTTLFYGFTLGFILLFDVISYP